jgi:amidase
LLEKDSIYKSTIERLKELGADIIEFEPPKTDLDGFSNVLNMDMKNDLPQYLKTHTNQEKVKIKNVTDIVSFNLKDAAVRMPYGQNLLEDILNDSTSMDVLDIMKTDLEKKGRTYFDIVMDEHRLHAVLSINNYHASYAAVAKYPALTVPMAYKSSGEPIGLTFIGKPFKEAHLLRMGSAFEKEFNVRKMPDAYK